MITNPEYDRIEVKQTDGMYTPIKDIKVGDYVNTHRNIKRPVQSVKYLPYEDHLIKIKTPLNDVTYVDKDALIYTSRGWIKATQIKKRDRLIVPFNDVFEDSPDISESAAEIIGILASLYSDIKPYSRDTLLIYPVPSKKIQKKIEDYITKMWPGNQYSIQAKDNGLFVESAMFINLYNTHFRSNFISNTLTNSNKRNANLIVDAIERYCDKGLYCKINTPNLNMADRLRSLLLRCGVYPFITKNNHLIFFKRNSFLGKKLSPMIIGNYQYIAIASISKVWYNGYIKRLHIVDNESYCLTSIAIKY